MILDGLFFINEKDIFLEYSVFLAEKSQGEHANYDALLKPPKLKDQTAVNIRELDGEKLPDALVNKFEARDITLMFGLYASNRFTWLAQRKTFVDFLRTGENGWLRLNARELDETFRVYVKDFPNWDQIAFDCSLSYGQFQVTFREPNPNF